MNGLDEKIGWLAAAAEKMDLPNQEFDVITACQCFFISIMRG